ncbi:hypothetical protein CPB84DRAFT_582185 [Gymnopilus junonius]|uniref:Uncharacterized protein n=1 Tax=Gymnopilus junonius TaxID=109634 RepID=A0A9P5TFF1_GYMJU|nr:hypothetical protein CPB84DRAFT_582185 [Gymnopilus junonius]
MCTVMVYNCRLCKGDTESYSCLPWFYTPSPYRHSDSPSSHMGSKQNSADPPPYEVRTSGHGINPTDQPSLSSGGSFWAPWKFLKGGRKTKNDVRARLRQMVQDMELDPDCSSNNSSGAQSNKTTPKSIKAILRGCEDACSEYSISFHTILQNQYIKGHSPLYWAIFQLSLSRPANLTNFDREALCDILSVIKSFCPHDMPLRVSSELRLACYSMSNQDAFRIFGLQRNTFPSIWGADQALLYDGSKGAVCTTDGFESDGSAFSVVIEMPSFHKDLMLTRNVGAEFVVRNRIWFLTLGYRGNDYSLLFVWVHGAQRCP